MKRKNNILAKFDMINASMKADQKIKQCEYIRNYTKFLYNLLENRTTIAGNLYDITIAYRQFYKTDNKLKILLKKVNGLPLKQQNMVFVKGILPTIVRYCKYLKQIRKDNNFYKRTDFENI